MSPFRAAAVVIAIGALAVGVLRLRMWTGPQIGYQAHSTLAVQVPEGGPGPGVHHFESHMSSGDLKPMTQPPPDYPSRLLAMIYAAELSPAAFWCIPVFARGRWLGWSYAGVFLLTPLACLLLFSLGIGWGCTFVLAVPITLAAALWTGIARLRQARAAS